ncbi:MAG TPA: FMN-binding negative transcriptional regulator [Sphingomicrobium sp.]|nr:FMN-binding negative transcriptional regulator [Sphingomicrobium sp.]
MHPNPAFEWTSRKEILDFVSEHPFAQVFTADGGDLFVVHAPLLVTEEGRIRFHVSRRNRAADHFASKALLISVLGREAYHSAGWYASKNQVPTWHYEAVEIEGEARLLSTGELVELLDRLSDRMEASYSPENPWTRAKMESGTFEAMIKAIVGFEVVPHAIRGTRKFNQHKSLEDMEAGIEGQRRSGRDDIVQAMNELRAK